MLENSSLAPFNPETVTDAEGDASGIGTRSGGYAAQIPDITSQTKVNKCVSQDMTHENSSLAPLVATLVYQAAKRPQLGPF